jgi:hypothetical protein
MSAVAELDDRLGTAGASRRFISNPMLRWGLLIAGSSVYLMLAYCLDRGQLVPRL